jgi:hypothetical protein
VATSSSLLRRTKSPQSQSVSFGFGHIGRQVVAQRVGIVAGQEVTAPTRPNCGCRRSSAFQVHELIGRHVVGQVQALPGFAFEQLAKSLSGAEQLAGQITAWKGMLSLPMK